MTEADLIEQHREMLQPGQGIVRDPGPNKQHEEFPRYMVHPGYQKGAPDKEIKELNENGSPTGRLFYRGGESIRFAPVLVRNAHDRDFHLSQGYEDKGKSDAAAFARQVADAETVPENYKPIEYPKYCFGKIVNDAVEEEARLIEVNVNKDGTPREAAAEPALNAEANPLERLPSDDPRRNTIALLNGPVSEEDEIAALEAKLAALKAKKAEPIVTLNEASITEPLVMKEPAMQVTGQSAAEIAQAVAAEAASAEIDAKAEKNEARIKKIRATIARKKAEREATAGETEKAA